MFTQMLVPWGALLDVKSRSDQGLIMQSGCMTLPGVEVDQLQVQMAEWVTLTGAVVAEETRPQAHVSRLPVSGQDYELLLVVKVKGTAFQRGVVEEGLWGAGGVCDCENV